MAFLSMGTLMGIMGLIEFTSGDTEIAAQSLMLSAGSILMGFMLMPAVYFSLMKVINKPAREFPLYRIPTLVLVIVWFISASLGIFLDKSVSTIILLIPFHLLTFVLPVWIIIRIGLRGLDAGSPERRWGTITVGMTIVPLLIGIAELMMILFIGLATIVWVSFNPSLMSKMVSLSTRLVYTTNPDALLRILSPYIFHPAVIFTGLVFLSVLIPLVEELIKPLRVWLSPTRIATPSQGFAIGVLAGAAYALVESLGISPSISNSGNILPIARAGTDLLHIVTTGLMGWALVSAFQEKKFLRLGLTYLTVVLLHGIWNALSLSLAAGTAIEYIPNPSPILNNLSLVSVLGLIIMTIINLAILFHANKTLQPITDKNSLT
jgi:hypothetical protein